MLQFLALTLASTSGALAQPTPDAPHEEPSLAIPHERYALRNGLDVVLAPDTSTPIAHVQIWYHVGSKDEPAGRTGFAHLFEHLMFQGSLHAPGDYFAPLQEIGADLNGTTNSDRTNYFETVPSRYLPLALFLESDRMGHLLEALDQQKLDNQRDVVRNERRQRYENPPYGEAPMLLAEALYPQGHPYHHTTIGSHEDLQAATLDDVKDFFRTWYVPNNATLVVTGDFDVPTAKALIEENFGWIPRGADPDHLEATPVHLAETRKIVEVDDVPDRKVWVAWHSPAFHAPGDAALDVAASVLCSGKDSRLYRRLVEGDRVARDVRCYQSSRKLGSNFFVVATVAEGHDTDAIVARVHEEIDALASSRPATADEVAAAVTTFEVGFWGNLQTIQGRASQISSYLFFTGEADHLAEDLARYTALTPADVTQWVGATLRAPAVELHYVPEAAASEGGAP